MHSRVTQCRNRAVATYYQFATHTQESIAKARIGSLIYYRITII